MLSKLLKRRELKDLKEWFSSKNRKPLLLRGARQVGKTSLVRMLAEALDLQLIEVNLELDLILRRSFEKLKPDLILKEILAEKGLKREERTLLFIDEIQMAPIGIQALRYFYEQMKDLPVIAAGSLLEFSLADFQYSMPVGRVDSYFLGPMMFSDFIESTNNSNLIEAFNSIDIHHPPEAYFHEKFLEIYYEFLIVGGMPEAIARFRSTEDLWSEVQMTHRGILYNYRNDFSKYSGRIPLERIEKVFDYASTHIGHKVKYSQISPDDQAKQVKLALDLLEKANILYKIKHSDCSGLPIKSGESENTYKLLFLDVGLFSHAMGFNSRYACEIFKKNPDQIQLLHKGMLTEQFIGQHLLYKNHFDPPHLNYWLRDKSNKKAEVDLVIQEGTEIIPVEIKGGKTGSIASLLQFCKDRKTKVALRYSTRPFQILYKSFESQKLTLIEIPIYGVEKYSGISKISF